MILECYQCQECFFEDTQTSSRMDPQAISNTQGRREFKDILLVFVCIEHYDGTQELQQATDELVSLLEMLGNRPIVLCANAHLSIDRADEHLASDLICQLHKRLIAAGIQAECLSFGYHKHFGMVCQGNVGSVVGRRFYGSPQKQFLRLLTRLGICPPETLPAGMPRWAHALLDRQLKVMVNRKQTYRVARQMLQEQLDASGHSELWTCMLFEGEREPMEDYLSTLHQIIQSYPDVLVHRAFNLSVPAFCNAARHLFRTYRHAIESGRLRIYNSTVRDLEFLLTPTEVLLAFPQSPSGPSLHAGPISFGLYCRDPEFARNMVAWYTNFLIDKRFGRIRKEAQLDTIINELADRQPT